MTDYKQQYRSMPIDFLILEIVPDKGMIGGVHWKGRRARDVRAELIAKPEIDESLISINLVQSRLRSLKIYGYAESFAGAGAGGTAIWARTPKGVELLNQKEEVLGG